MAGTAFSSKLNLGFRDFWSVPDADDLITLNATAADEPLPDVVVNVLPSGLSIARVTAIVVVRELYNSSGADNSLVLAGTEHIQVRKSGGTYVDAIQLVAGEWLALGGATGNGFPLVGSIDIKAEVNAAGTYNFQIENADVTAADLLLRGIQTVLRFWLE